MRTPTNRLTKTTGAPAGLPFLVSRILSTLHLRHAAGPAETAGNPPAQQCIRIREKVCEGMRIADLHILSDRHIVVRKIRCRRTWTTRIASPEMCLRQGDLILAEGSRADLDAFCEEVGGQRASVDYLNYADAGSLAVHVQGLTRNSPAKKLASK